MNRRKIFAGLFLVSTLFGVNSESARAELVGGATLVPTNYAYLDYNGGDDIFPFVTPINDCFGAWIAPTQPGAKAAIAIVTASMAISRSLNVYVDRTIVWNGSAAKYCKVHAVGFTQQ
jgi:hypothetical protein